VARLSLVATVVNKYRDLMFWRSTLNRDAPQAVPVRRWRVIERYAARAHETLN
jgi:hypothetical protein